MSELLKINVNDHTEKKGQLTYLSWAWAWAEVLKHDAGATWRVHQYGVPGHEQPCMWIGDTAIVHTSVTINGLCRECLLPVMDNKNNAVKNPDARKISDAIMRCMTKAIAMHGLGLYIYAGEDLPETEESPQKTAKTGAINPVREIANADPMTEEEAAYIAEFGGEMVAMFSSGRELDALRMWRSVSDQKLQIHLWNWLQSESKLRAFLKANKSTTTAVAA